MTDRVTGEVVRALIADARRLENDYGDSYEVMCHMSDLADALEAVYDAGRRELADRFRRAAIEDRVAWEEQG